MAVEDYNLEPDLNTTISGINIAEGCPPSGINNAIRQLMADVKQEHDAVQTVLTEEVGNIREGTLAAAQQAYGGEAVEGPLTSEEYIVQLRDALKKIGGMRPLGEEYIRVTGQSAPAGGVDYVGQTATRAMYADLWAWVQENKLESIVSEDEWQALSVSQNGNVPYYSTGDGSTTFRFPRMVGYPKFAGSVDEVGKYVAEGLPNIAGGVRVDTVGAAEAYGAFTATHVNGDYPLAGANYYTNQTYFAEFNAARANAIYSASDHVTPETVCIIAGVIAFGAPSAVGQADTEGILAELEMHGAELESIQSEQIPDAVNAAAPVGTVIAFAATADIAPEGYLYCIGSVVSRTTYAKLFSVIGTAYGAGDGSTTFNLPDLRGRYIEGQSNAAIGTYWAPGLPNFTGTIRVMPGYTGGAFSEGGRFSNEDPGSSGESSANVVATLNPAAVNGIYGASNTVQPPAVTMRYFIKY